MKLLTYNKLVCTDHLIKWSFMDSVYSIRFVGFREDIC